MPKSRLALVLSLFAAMLSTASTVRAQDASLGYAYLFGYGAMNTPAIRSFVPAPPYFALHPPVYYGKRYVRPYGDSPFASWPQLRSPADYMPRPAAATVQPVIINFAPEHIAPAACEAPVVPAAPAAPAAPAGPPSPVVQRVPAIGPVVIDNPYYRAESRLVRSAPGSNQLD